VGLYARSGELHAAEEKVAEIFNFCAEPGFSAACLRVPKVKISVTL
jgi:hypothetical protein